MLDEDDPELPAGLLWPGMAPVCPCPVLGALDDGLGELLDELLLDELELDELELDELELELELDGLELELDPELDEVDGVGGLGMVGVVGLLALGHPVSSIVTAAQPSAVRSSPGLRVALLNGCLPNACVISPTKSLCLYRHAITDPWAKLRLPETSHHGVGDIVIARVRVYSLEVADPASCRHVKF